MIRLAWLFVALLLGTVPAFFSSENMMPDPFPLMDFPDGIFIAYTTYVSMICDFIATIIYSWVLFDVTKSKAIFVFFLLSIGDLFDFLVCYNVIWVMVGSIPLSFNVVRYAIFSTVIFLEWNQYKSIGR